MTREYKPINISFRWTYIIVSFIALCSACIISLGFILLGINLFYKGPITNGVMIVITLTMCLLSISIGGGILWYTSRWFSKPINTLDKHVQKVAKGSFGEVILEQKPRVGSYKIHNELTTLVTNFNIMTKELGDMAYISRDFMSNVSHEIKTPLAILTGITELLEEGELDKEEEKMYLAIANDTSQRIGELCESMAQLSRLEHQHILENQTTIRVDEQLRQAVLVVEERYRIDNRAFELLLEPVNIRGNAALLNQVWINLIDNAFKYSPQGTPIHISIEEVSEQEKYIAEVYKDYSVVISITNEGEAIPDDKVKRIFEPFYQCDESHHSKGSGLGLSIARRIILLHEGLIECISGREQGVTMRVFLKLSGK